MPGSISGKVTDTGGLGLSGITVQVVGNSSARAITNSQGNYTITNLNAGTYTVSVVPGGSTFNPPTRIITLSSNQNSANNNFTQS